MKPFNYLWNHLLEIVVETASVPHVLSEEVCLILRLTIFVEVNNGERVNHLVGTTLNKKVWMLELFDLLPAFSQGSTHVSYCSCSHAALINQLIFFDFGGVEFVAICAGVAWWEKV